jgi:hypothetical protein
MASELVEQSLEKAATDAAGEAMKIKPAPQPSPSMRGEFGLLFALI